MPQEWKKDKNTWLTTTDLWETIKRLMDKHKEFHSEPPLPALSAFFQNFRASSFLSS